MRDWNTKIDDNETSAGEVIADEYNSLFDELKNVVSPITALSEVNPKQLVESIDKLTKASLYADTGTANTILLSRPLTASALETLVDGMTFFFKPKFANTGATTLKVTTLTAKNAFYNGVALVSGFLNPLYIYVAIYDAANGRFNIDGIVNKAQLDAEGGLEIASTAEAQAQTDNTKAITPLRLAEALQGANQSLSASGYQKMPGGLIIQWGVGSVGVSSVTFPITFPNAVLKVITNPNTTNSSAIDGRYTTATSITLSGYTALVSISNTPSFIAIGY